MFHVIINYIMSFFKRKVYSNEELEFSSKKFNIKKFAIVSTIILLTVITLFEFYLIFKLAKKYQDMESLYHEQIAKYNERTRIYNIEIKEYKDRFDNLNKEYNIISKCLEDSAHKFPTRKELEQIKNKK